MWALATYTVTDYLPLFNPDDDPPVARPRTSFAYRLACAVLSILKLYRFLGKSLMAAIANNLPGPLYVPGDVLHLRDELEGPDLAPGYWVMLEVIGHYAAICPTGRTRRTGRFAGGGGG